MDNKMPDTEKIKFAQTPYFSSRESKLNFRGAQEPEHAPDFTPRVLDILVIFLSTSFITLVVSMPNFWDFTKLFYGIIILILVIGISWVFLEDNLKKTISDIDKT